jgi:hypothetical protein
VGTNTASSAVWTDTSVKPGASYPYEVIARTVSDDSSKPSNAIASTIP